ncbi:hypothetical protein SPD48_10575 [Pseudogracilibacillus sp. SE30717A]|uniref:hypothetical protein n=1 Tax=Pseudogracilibacillus sp. SE30717A TaxID=3098293 RepID=UPI00300DE717
MKKSDMWLTILASIGVGAAAYYTISKSDKPMSKAIESVTPMLSGMSGSGMSGMTQNKNESYENAGNNSGMLGPHGMS